MTPHECILASFALASSGHWVEARDNLRRNPPCLDTVEGLDLLARIELRCGDETEARCLWQRSIDKGLDEDGRCRTAIAALNSFDWRHRRAIRRVRFAFLAVAYAVIAWLALVGILATFFQNRSASTATAPESVGEIAHTEKPDKKSGSEHSLRKSVASDPAVWYSGPGSPQKENENAAQI